MRTVVCRAPFSEVGQFVANTNGVHNLQENTGAWAGCHIRFFMSGGSGTERTTWPGHIQIGVSPLCVVALFSGTKVHRRIYEIFPGDQMNGSGHRLREALCVIHFLYGLYL